MYKVSVIMPSYNCAKYLGEALDSVLAQTYPYFEAIVIDDGSTDDTQIVVGRYLKDDRVKYIYQENQGLASARNTGLKTATGDYIALLDADDKWAPERLQESVQALDRMPDVGLVHAHAENITEDNRPIEILKRNKKYLSGKLFIPLFLRQAHISCPTATFRRSCVEKSGLMDENLTRLGNEDRDYWLRIAQNYKIYFIDKVLAYYRIRATSMSKDTTKMLKARLYVVDKFTPEGGLYVDLRRKALGKIYRDLGDELLLSGRYEEAKAEYKRSIQYDKTSFWSIVNLLKCYVKKARGRKGGSYV